MTAVRHMHVDGERTDPFTMIEHLTRRHDAPDEIEQLDSDALRSLHRQLHRDHGHS